MRLIINSSQLVTTNNTIKIYIPPDIQIKVFSIISAYIPYSFYNITSNGNTFKVNGLTYTLPNKNYNAYQLKDAIKLLITNTAVSVAFDKQSLHFKFASLSSFTFDALLLGTILGFSKSTVYTSTLVNGVYVLESVSAIDMSNGVKHVCLRTNLNLTSVYENGVLGGAIMYRIPINTNFGNNIIYHNLSNDKLNININSALTVLELSLIDSNYNVLNFNNSTYIIEFYIETTDDVEFERLAASSSLFNIPNAQKIQTIIHPYELLKTR